VDKQDECCENKEDNQIGVIPSTLLLNIRVITNEKGISTGISDTNIPDIPKRTPK